MTDRDDRDIVAELRRLWEAAPQGEWEYSGPFNDGDSAGYIEVRDSDGDWWPVVGIGIDRPEVIHLIVAMHNYLPQLLDVVEAVQTWDEAARSTDFSDSSHNHYMGALESLRAALAAMSETPENTVRLLGELMQRCEAAERALARERESRPKPGIWLVRESSGWSGEWIAVAELPSTLARAQLELRRNAMTIDVRRVLYADRERLLPRASDVVDAIINVYCALEDR